ncbi:radical SAM family heme chaperone HemW [Teredinibacter waterburyi]|jgi:coproporphyrinogen III oxidase, anaerobic (EC 1.3.99.22)|uniref:radical SAM family heme chaperone HemW n=1 Tax=Teredinibacter waterburyi TaxID=1500538 RepID=UPI00165EE8E0|nr:radical SAM family heme chaperone HemW [Teredinibacter waterburyi]
MPVISKQTHLKLSCLPPLALYIHIPWCVRKCPYCDFNSHQPQGELPVKAYTAALIEDLSSDAYLAQGRKISSIFFGGGTPSLFPASAIAKILQSVERIVGLEAEAEITLEANPGTAEYDNFSGYRDAGVTRISMGVQSFDAQQLKTLGRIHNPDEVFSAFAMAREAGFNNINLDLMHGLPGQTATAAMKDLQQALELAPEHLSWYQLTIETNTEFYSRPPKLPEDEQLWQIQTEGQTLLAAAGYQQYEISAYARSGQQARHNLNYWGFGDYLAIGAGAHGKITLLDSDLTGSTARQTVNNEQVSPIFRFNKTRLPQHYLTAATKATGAIIGSDKSQRSTALANNPYTAQMNAIAIQELPFEFMMNALRLNQGVERALFQQRTGLALSQVQPILDLLTTKGLLEQSTTRIQPSPQGSLFLNSLLEYFL